MSNRLVIRRHPRPGELPNPWMVIRPDGMTFHRTHAAAIREAGRVWTRQRVQASFKRLRADFRAGRAYLAAAWQWLRDVWAEARATLREIADSIPPVKAKPTPAYVDLLRADARRDYRAPSLRPASMDAARPRTTHHPIYRASGRR